MSIQNLLNKDIHCSCGRTHRCNIGSLVIRQGALRALPEATQAYHHILLIADQNTYPLCGAQVCALLGDALEKTYVFQATGHVVPNEEAVERIEAQLSPDTDLILGIGSGVINDLCKYVSFYHGMKSGIIATAPSMDGFASSGAAMILNGMKVTVTTHSPDIILGDTAILKNAPMDMIRAGYGDIIGKYSSLNDWELSHLVTGEHFCPEIHSLVLRTTDEIRDCVTGIASREEKAIEKLMNALVLIGMTLTLVETTRPGSGSEHHLSHFYEIVGLIHGQPHLPHGTDVAYNTIITAGMREDICTLFSPDFCEESDEARARAWKRIFCGLTGEIEALQCEAGSYTCDLRPVYRKKWEKIKAILSKCPTAAECDKMMQAVGLDFSEYESLYGEEKIKNAMLYGKDLKNRYSVLWLYYALFSGKADTADYKHFFK